MRKNERCKRAVLVITVVFALMACAEVTVTEGVLKLPTYLLDPPEKAPLFDCDWSYQRARRSVYPYPLNDNMTRVRKDVEHKALYLENEFVKLCVLPDIGGRLFYAIDKTDGYDIFYHNDSIKPQNIGMLGAWISGGVEWNVFHHHRNTSHSPVNYRLIDNGDGSKSIWVGETERRHRMSWAIGITLRPGRSYIEIDGRLINSTPNANSMLYWNNVATKVDENYQIIFPPSTEFGTFHCKESFCHWPITHEAFTKKDEYLGGLRADWWKAHPSSNSIFVHDLKDDFIAGYDHGRRAGTVLVANHHIVKGGKFWSWGPNSGWDTKLLTENAGHYIELMTGAYSDNQPDYNWSWPGEVKTFKCWWYGLREMGGVKKAAPRAAMNLDFADGKVKVGVNATGSETGLTITLSRKGVRKWSKTFDCSPRQPFLDTVDPGDAAGAESDWTLALTDAAGKQILAYTPVTKNPDKPLPDNVKPPARPKDIPNNEACFLVGLRNLQFHNPFVNPADYFSEVLRRDPDDTRANTMLGYMRRIRFDFAGAECLLRRAVARPTKDYTHVKDAEATYNLALVLKETGRIDEAIELFYKSVWNYPWNAPANLQLARIYVARGEDEKALERIEEALIHNADLFDALNLKASMLRRQGRADLAKAVAARVLARDPVNVYALRESGDEKAFRALMRDDTESYLELALAYQADADLVSAKALLNDADKLRPYPTVKFHLAARAEAEGRQADATALYETALGLDVDWCNPFRLETLRILRHLEKLRPSDPRVHYYLGNLLYDKQNDAGMAAWRKVIERDPDHALAWRNLGWGYWKGLKDPVKAAEMYRKALALDTRPIFLEEAVQVYTDAGVAPRVIFDLLKPLHATCLKRYVPLAAEVITGTQCGEYDYALNLLRTCYFPTREGVANFHDIYLDTLMMAGHAKLLKGDKAGAANLFREGFTFPENHNVIVYDTRRPRDAELYYNLGLATGLRTDFEKAAAVDTRRTDYRYWRGRALERLGRTDEARQLFRELVRDGHDRRVRDQVNFYGAEGTTGDSVSAINARAAYTRGLGAYGLGLNDEARHAFDESLALKPHQLYADFMARTLK